MLFKQYVNYFYTILNVYFFYKNVETQIECFNDWVIIDLTNVFNILNENKNIRLNETYIQHKYYYCKFKLKFF